MGVNVVGKIDLEEYMQGRKVPVRKAGVFKLRAISCSFYDQPLVDFDFGPALSEPESKGGYFSLLLGRNGVCKSSLLRELIEFFINARVHYSRKKKSPVTIYCVCYVIDLTEYQINYDKGKYYYKRNGQPCSRNEMDFPLVIASTMGMFDKFPLNSQPNTKNGRYNIHYYHYVGPKASNNMFTSKANVLLQQLSMLPSIQRLKQLEMLSVILDFIGYSPKIVFTFAPKESQSRSMMRNDPIEPGDEKLFNEIVKGKVCSVDVNFRNTTLTAIKSLPLQSLYRLRQKGFITNLRCKFFKKKDEVDADYLSSGEFNLLCIVMSVVLAAESQHLLLLLDEPEISQHPNWQLDMIPNLEKALIDFGCHFLIATHCHFLVSNLPMGRSNVICMSRDKDDIIHADSLPSDTYGWSAEEVLLKAFSVPTDRSRYLAQMVSDFLKGIGERSIENNEVSGKVEFFRNASLHLSSYDPMKKILDTIVNEFMS